VEAFLPDTVKAILVALIATVIILGLLAKRFPHMAWLQVFRLPENRLSAREQERHRREQNRLAGVEFILLGIGIPLVYLAVTMMFFAEPALGVSLIIGASSVLCIALGIVAIAKSR
jgi:hypothetical protein